jgi:hypothetical protein
MLTYELYGMIYKLTILRLSIEICDFSTEFDRFNIFVQLSVGRLSASSNVLTDKCSWNSKQK